MTERVWNESWKHIKNHAILYINCMVFYDLAISKTYKSIEIYQVTFTRKKILANVLSKLQSYVSLLFFVFQLVQQTPSRQKMTFRTYRQSAAIRITFYKRKIQHDDKASSIKFVQFEDFTIKCRQVDKPDKLNRQVEVFPTALSVDVKPKSELCPVLYF